jgi:hypothetical protein
MGNHGSLSESDIVISIPQHQNSDYLLKGY